MPYKPNRTTSEHETFDESSFTAAHRRQRAQKLIHHVFVVALESSEIYIDTLEKLSGILGGNPDDFGVSHARESALRLRSMASLFDLYLKA